MLWHINPLSRPIDFTVSISVHGWNLALAVCYCLMFPEANPLPHQEPLSQLVNGQGLGWFPRDLDLFHLRSTLIPFHEVTEHLKLSLLRNLLFRTWKSFKKKKKEKKRKEKRKEKKKR